MDKSSLSQYGWVIILIIILSITITMATPFGDFVAESAVGAGENFVEFTYDMLGMPRPLKDASSYFCVDKYGVLEYRSLYRKNSADNKLLVYCEDNKITNLNEAFYSILYTNMVLNDDSGTNQEIYSRYKASGLSKKQVKEKIKEAVSEELSVQEVRDAYSTQCPDKEVSLREFALNLMYDELVPDGYVSERDHFMTVEELNAVGRNVVASVIGIDPRELSKEENEEIYYEAVGVSREDYDLFSEGGRKRFLEDTNSSYEAYKPFFNSLDTFFFDFNSFTFEDMLPLMCYSPSSALVTLTGLDLLDGKFDINLYWYGSDYGYRCIAPFKDMQKAITKKAYKLPSSFSIPDEINNSLVLSIPDEFFYRNKDIKIVRLPSSVISIGERAFYECNRLTSVELPANLECFGKYAFAYCSALESIDIPGTVKKIPRYCFTSCSALEEVTINEGTEYIEQYAFSVYGSRPVTVRLPSSLNQLDSYSLNFNQNITVFEIKKGSYVESWFNSYNYNYVYV